DTFQPSGHWSGPKRFRSQKKEFLRRQNDLYYSAVHRGTAAPSPALLCCIQGRRCPAIPGTRAVKDILAGHFAFETSALLPNHSYLRICPVPHLLPMLPVIWVSRRITGPRGARDLCDHLPYCRI